jgi:hypothetical protein
MQSIDETPIEFEVISEITGRPIDLHISVTSAHAKAVSSLLKSKLTQIQRINDLHDSASIPIANDLELEILSAAGRIVGWRGIVEPFTRENAIILCSTNPYIRQQVINVSNDISMKLEEHIASLVKYAEHELKLSEKQKDGSTLRDALTSLYRNHGISDPLLEPIEFAASMIYLWEHFLNLNSTRPSGMSIGSITYSEIKAYCDMNGLSFSPFEVRIIKMLDRVFLDHYNKQSEKESSSNK